MEVKVLVVEDEALPAMILSLNLKNAQYVVVGPVATGEEAIIIAREKHPHIIVMDINLQGKINGIEAASEISDFLDTNIIFVTGYDEKELKESAMKLNPTDYLIKPVEFHQIISIIKKLDLE